MQTVHDRVGISKVPLAKGAYDMRSKIRQGEIDTVSNPHGDCRFWLGIIIVIIILAVTVRCPFPLGRPGGDGRIGGCRVIIRPSTISTPAAAPRTVGTMSPVSFDAGFEFVGAFGAAELGGHFEIYSVLMANIHCSFV